LVLKFVHKLHQPESLPWKEWYFWHSGQDLGVFSSTPSFLEKIVVVCLPLYRAMACCSIVSGTSTSFWLDKWMPDECLAARFPALFSHVTHPHVTVQVVVGSGIDLQRRLSSAAAVDLAAVHDIIAAVFAPRGLRRPRHRRAFCSNLFFLGGVPGSHPVGPQGGVRVSRLGLSAPDQAEDLRLPCRHLPVELSRQPPHQEPLPDGHVHRLPRHRDRASHLL
jgi:hypothetical protein